MNLGPALRLASVLVCLVAIVILIVDDTPDLSWLFGGLFAAIGLFVAGTVVGEFPRRNP